MKSTFLAVAVSVSLIGAAALSLWALRTPVPLPASAPAPEFSARRAIRHVAIMAAEPHPAGSPANDQVKAYICDTLRSYGIETLRVSERYVNGSDAGQRDLVLARLPGKKQTKAFALMAHYDSVPYGPGAADDGAGVGAMLEIARALTASPRLDNEVIFVFTDGEEWGHLGAQALAAHPWFQRIGVMLNFEARGTTGNSILFGLSEHNGWLVRQVARAVRYPCGSSLGYEVYKRIPFGTDFDGLRAKGLIGMDIAFVENFAWYHTMNDSPSHLDLGTLQQHGMYGLDLANHLGNLKLDGDLTAPNELFFNAVGYRLVHYPLAWGTVLAVITVIVVLITLVAGIKRKHLSMPEVFTGVWVWFLAAVTAVLVAMAMVALIWGPRTALTLYTKDITRIPDLFPLHQNGLFTTACAAASLMVVALVYNRFWGRLRVQSLAMGALLWWVAALVAVAIYLPGASYLLMWPLACSAIGNGLIFFRTRPGHIPNGWILLQTLLALPAIMLLTPVYHLLAAALMIMFFPGLALLVVLVAGLLVPQMALLSRVLRYGLPAAAGAVAMALVAIGLANSAVTPLRPTLASLTYAIDYDTRRAYWLSADTKVNAWTAQFFPPGTPRVAANEFFGGTDDRVLKSPAPILEAYPGPGLEVTSETVVAGVRTLILHLSSPAKAARLMVQVASGQPMLDAAVFGKRVAADTRGWGLHFNLFPREGADLTLRLPAETPLKIKVTELLYGVPTPPGVTPRPADISIAPNTIENNFRKLAGNQTVVVRTFDL